MESKVERLESSTKERTFKLVILTVLTMGTILFFFIGSYKYYRDMIVKGREENMLRIVKIASSQLEYYFSDKDILLSEINKDPDFQQDFINIINGEENEISFLELLFEGQSNQYKAIEIIDDKGELKKVYTKFQGYTYKKGEDIERVINTKENTFYIETKGDRTINLIHPILRGSKMYGMVRIKIDSDYIYNNFLGGYTMDGKGYISVKDNQARLFLHPSNEFLGEDVVEVRKKQYPNYDWSGLEEIVKIQMENQSGIGEYYSIWPGDGSRIKKLSAYSRAVVGDGFLIVNFTVDYKETVSSLNVIALITVLLSAIVIIASIIIIIYIYKIENKKNKLIIESMYSNQLREKNALLMQQSKFASMGEMLAAISHQLKQPLNALKLSIYNIEDYYLLGENDKEYIDKLLGSNHKYIDKIAKTVEDFRYFFKPQDENSIFKIRDTIDFALDLNMSRINNLGVKIKVECNDNIQIIGESNIFTQVILNLINNSLDALKEISEERHINIGVDVFDENIFINIYDNGGGLKEEIMGKLFEPYVTTKGASGTGLGLYISKIILKEKFSGEIFVANWDDGVLATIILPKGGINVHGK